MSEDRIEDSESYKAYARWMASGLDDDKDAFYRCLASGFAASIGELERLQTSLGIKVTPLADRIAAATPQGTTAPTTDGRDTAEPPTK